VESGGRKKMTGKLVTEYRICSETEKRKATIVAASFKSLLLVSGKSPYIWALKSVLKCDIKKPGKTDGRQKAKSCVITNCRLTDHVDIVT